jgi:hypothetical protein
MEGLSKKEKKESDSTLFDAYKKADDMCHYLRECYHGEYKKTGDQFERINALEFNNQIFDKEPIKRYAGDIKQKLENLGVANLPPDSKLGKAYTLTSQLIENYEDVRKSTSSMGEIAILIKKSEGFEESSKKWHQDND